MNLVAARLGKKHNMRFVLEQTPAESTAYRFAKLDMKHFPEAQKVVKGNLSLEEIYYTNSTLFNVGAAVDPIERVKREGLFHPLIEAGLPYSCLAWGEPAERRSPWRTSS